MAGDIPGFPIHGLCAGSQGKNDSGSAERFSLCELVSSDDPDYWVLNVRASLSW